MDGFEACLMMMCIILCYITVVRIRKPNRRWWVRTANLSRDTEGYYNTCFQRIKECDPEAFFKHTRMSRAVYELLFTLLRENLTKKSIRTPIPAECRLAITLSYLSQGVSHQFLAWSYKVGKSTIREIIMETCDVIWECLCPVYVSQPNLADYQQISKDFQSKWDIPNCVGAIDGKHISIQRPPNSGSCFYNYKNHFSIVLLAACDANYCFTAVDVGAFGSQSDGGILTYSEFGKQLFDNKLPLPAPSFLPKSSIKFPYYFIGDPAFPLKEYIIRPYPGKLLTREKRIFNYRISRARVVIENTFGILVARWRVLRSTMNCFPENVEKVVLATIALHNFIKLNETAQTYCPPNFVDWEDEEGNMHPGDWRKEINAAMPSARSGSNNASRSAFQLRDTLMKYFLNEGTIERQNKIK